MMWNWRGLTPDTSRQSEFPWQTSELETRTGETGTGFQACLFSRYFVANLEMPAPANWIRATLACNPDPPTDTIAGMRRWVRLRLTLRNRFTVIVALLIFLAGNIGWPVTIGSAAGGKCCKVAGLAKCCCGDKPGAKNCGCNKGTAVARQTPAKKLPSCCQKRLDAAQKAALVVNCACGESSTPGFVISTQPKITAVAVNVAELTLTGDLIPAPASSLPQANLAPETPPPRSSVG